MHENEKIKIVIWGTGGQAGSKINYNEVWLKNAEIVCFVSNAHAVGTEEQFYQKPVINPSEIYEYRYDYIIILSSYIEEITKQIVEELQICRDRIITLEKLAEEIINQTKISIIDKDVLLYGKKYDDYAYIYHLSQRTHSLKIVSDGKNKLVSGVEVVDIHEMQKETYDYLLLIDKDEDETKELFENLSKVPALNKDVVLKMEEWIANLAFDYCKIKNESNVFYYSIVPRPHHGLMGLFPEYLRNCDYARMNGYIPFIDMQNSANMYLSQEKFGKENAWENYFTQTKCAQNKTLDNIYKNQNVIIPSMFVKINKNRDIVKSKIALDNLKNNYHQFFDINPDVLKKVDVQYKQIFQNVKDGKVLGCIYRGTDYKNIKPANHMIQPDLETFIEVCKEKMQEWNCEYVFVATEDAEALNEMQNIFGDKLLYTNQLRYYNTGNQFLAQIKNSRENDEFLRGYEYLEALLILTKCHCLVSGQNGALSGALLLKEDEYEQKYIFDMGKYAVTNQKYI